MTDKRNVHEQVEATTVKDERPEGRPVLQISPAKKGMGDHPLEL